MEKELPPPGDSATRTELPPAPHSNVLAPMMPAPPSPRQQSWGVVISTVVIVLMLVVGAFYAWGERIAEERALSEPFSLE